MLNSSTEGQQAGGGPGPHTAVYGQTSASQKVHRVAEQTRESSAAIENITIAAKAFRDQPLMRNKPSSQKR